MAPRRRIGGTALLLAGALGCHDAGPARGPALPTLASVSDSQWAALATAKIYFGHQSVGRNILAGVQEILAQNPRIKLRIVESTDPAGVSGPALVHTDLGNNGYPQIKAAEFESQLAHGVGNGGGIVMYKYCFVDFDDTTNVQTVFDTYRDGIERIRSSHPDLRIVHITAPLARASNPYKEFARRMLGRVTYGDVNAKRNLYSRLLRQSYAGRDPIFDLARLESTHADGSRQFIMVRGDTVFTLAPELTDDGGHLNEKGRRFVGEQFLVFLANVAGSPPAKPPAPRQ
jgi:lysophospholipase L1-like esterase